MYVQCEMEKKPSKDPKSFCRTLKKILTAFVLEFLMALNVCTGVLWSLELFCEIVTHAEVWSEFFEGDYQIFCMEIFLLSRGTDFSDFF